MNGKNGHTNPPNGDRKPAGIHPDKLSAENSDIWSKSSNPTDWRSRLQETLQRVKRSVLPEARDPAFTAERETEAALYAVFTVDGKGYIQSCNPACLSLLNYGSEIIGMPLSWVMWSREESEQVERMVQTVFREGRSYEGVEMRYRDRSDQVCHSLTRLYPIYDGNRHVKACGIANLRVGDLNKTLFALRESENKFRQFVQQSPDGIFMVDEDGLVVEWNPMMECLTGIPRSEALGRAGETIWNRMTLEEQRSPERREHTRRLMQKFRDTGQADFLNHPLERRLESPDGAVRFILESNFSIETGRGYMLGGLLRDISDRKLIQNAEIEQRVLAETLREMFLDIGRQLDLDEVLDRILIHLERVVPYDVAFVSLIENGQAVVKRSQGASPNGKPFNPRIPLPVKGNADLETMVMTGRPYIGLDLHSDPAGKSAEGSEWVRSTIAAPILVEERTAGFLTLFSAQPKFYHPEHTDRLVLFAEQAAVALRNARLFEDIHRYARQVSLLNEIAQEGLRAGGIPEMLDRLARRLQDFYRADGVYILLWDEKNQVPIPTAATGPTSRVLNSLRFQPGEKTFSKAVLTAGQVIVVEDLQAQRELYPVTALTSAERALIGLPLQDDKRRLGTVIIGYKQPRLFGVEETALAEQAARQLSLVLSKAQMLEAERRRTAQVNRANMLITTLSQVATELETQPEPDSGMQLLGAALRRLNLNSLIVLLEPDQRDLALGYISLDAARLRQLGVLTGTRQEDFRFRPERFLGYDQVILRRQPLFLPDPLPAVRHALPEIPEASLYPIARMVGITVGVKAAFLPMAVEERVTGILLVWGSDLQEGDLTALSLFANQVAAALHRASLYSEIQQMAITDPLTNLYNRRGFFELGYREFERSQRFNRPLVAAMLDIDHFKEINDRHGHGVGDQVLSHLAQLCLKGLREIDLIGRYGGEEFVLLLPENDLVSGSEVCERLRKKVEAATIKTDAGEITITISLGLSGLDNRIHDLSTLIERADQALYQAKQQGRNRIVLSR